jgi:hypothetical protein
MPERGGFRSEAQRRKFGELVKEGKISQSEFNKWNKETGKRRLPDRIKPKKAPTGGRR